MVEKQDAAPNPVHAGLFGAEAVVVEADFIANLLDQPDLTFIIPLL